MNINVGDEITVNCTVVKFQKDAKIAHILGGYELSGEINEDAVFCKTKSGWVVAIPVSDINTIHPYKEPSKEDNRKGN